MGKRMLFVIVISAMVFMLCACGSTGRWPRLRIEPTTYRSDSINIPLREGYQFAEDAYGIEETDVGYDIVVHALKATE